MIMTPTYFRSFHGTILCLCIFGGLAFSPLAAEAPDRITLPDGRKVFVAGCNLAWINFAADVGDTDLDLRKFKRAVKDVADAGGNTLRVWLSTNGSRDPVFGADGLVAGPGSKTLSNVHKMLDACRERGLLLMPVLLTHNYLQKQPGVDLDRNRRLLTTDAGLQAFIDRYVVPLVQDVGNDPALLCWEIANEAEGMVDRIGWTDRRIGKADVQRFTNRIAAAIRRAVPGVLVSTGTVSADRLDWYRDDALRNAGGEPGGVLDFYMVHYYGWNGTDNSPFRHPASRWNMGKPLVAGEFASSDWSPSVKSSSPLKDSMAVADCLPRLWDTGYAGGLFWQYQPDGGDPWMKGWRTAGPALKAFAAAHPDLTVPAP